MNLDHRFILRHGLPGLVGSALVAAGALGVGWLPPSSSMTDSPLVSALRSSLTGSLAARAMVILGLAVLLQAWLVLGWELLGRRRRTRPARTIRDLSIVLTAWTLPMVICPPLFSRDAYSYYVQGRVFGAGFDPTTTGIGVIPGWFEDGADPMWIESPTPYGPTFLLIERTVANVVHPNAYLGALAFRLLAVVGVAMLAWLVPALARRHGIDPARALWLGVLNPVILMHFIAGAHNDALMTGLLVLGLLLAVERHPAWGVVAVSVAATIKPIALLALPFVGLLWAGAAGGWGARIRAWALACVIAVAAITPIVVVAGAGTGALSATVSTPGGVLTWLAPSTMVGRPLGSLTTALGWTEDYAPALQAVRLLGIVAALVAIAWLVLRPSGRSPVRGAALALGVVVLLGPVIQPWYLLWFLPLFAVTGLSVIQMRIAVLATAVFVVHGMIESSANADNLTDLADTISFAVSIGIVALILVGGRRERYLLAGRDTALEPETSDESTAAAAMRWPERAGERR